MKNINSNNEIKIDGSNNRISVGNTNNIIINAEIDTSIKRLKKDFDDTNFEQAVNDLASLMKENEHNPKVKYQLLLVKIDFLREFREMDDFKDYIELIESKYSEFIDNKFRELKLTLLASLGNETFFQLSKELRLEIDDSKPQGHFDIVYYLNSGNLNKAKEKFDKEIENVKYKDLLFLLGGHIYSNLYNYGEDDGNYFYKADNYYQQALTKGNLSFFDKMQIQSFYTTYFLNNQIRYRNSDDGLLKYVEQYYDSLKIVIANKLYFNSDYLDSLSDKYMMVLLSTNKVDEYLAFYEFNEDKLSMKDYIQYCEVKGIEYNHPKIQGYIKSNFILDDLISYASLVENSNCKDIYSVVDFIKENDYLYKHNLVVYFFTQGSILLRSDIDNTLLEYLKNNIFIELNILMAYIRYLYFKDEKIDNIYVEKLIEFSSNDKIVTSRIFDVIELLHLIEKRKEYLTLVIEKQDIFHNIIFKTLQICENDKNLLFEDFDKFVNNIKDKEYLSGILGNTYCNYNKLNVAFEYYYLEFKKNNNLELMFVLLNVGLTIYTQSNEIYEEQKQKEIFNCICSDMTKLEIDNLIFLLRYSVDIFKDTKQILPILNHKLLSTNIENLDEDLKTQLSGMVLYLLTIYNINKDNDEELMYEGNLCLTKDDKVYVKDNFIINDENRTNFNITSFVNSHYELTKYDDSYTEISLFHKIAGSFIGHGTNKFVKTIMIDTNSDNPFSEIFDMLKQNGNATKDMFQRYSDGYKIGLYQLAGKEYEQYFHLIHRLAEDVSINFVGGSINYKDKSINKILTISSIIFLNHIEQLDEVLKRDDIFVQRTLVNWLQSYISELHTTKEIFSMSSDGENYYKHIENKEKIDSVKKYLLSIATKIISSKNIIEDQFEVLPIKGAYQMLAKEIGKQEYQALAYCINHNYQIITEDSIYDMLFNEMKYHKSFISNSIVLLRDTMEYKDLRSLIIKLHSKNYKYLLDDFYLQNLVSYMQSKNILDLADEEKELIKIAYSYGWLDKMQKYYDDKFKVLYPKITRPVETLLDNNIKKVFEIINYQSEKILEIK